MILIKNLDLIATFNNNEQIIKNGNILIDGCEIRSIGSVSELDLRSTEVIDGGGKVALPGFINTHHHFFQQLTRSVPAVHNTSILEWFRYLYPIWGKVDEEAMYYASLLSCAELLLTGCTSTSDLAYFYPYGRTNLIDVEIKAASEIGIRFHPCRASMPFMEADLSQILEKQGINTKQLTEEPDLILSECERVIKKFNQQEKYSMCRVAIGQTDKSYLQPEFMRQMADFARQNGVMLHTHLHPRMDEIALCKKLFNNKPIDFLEEYGWLGEDVCLAHATNFSSYDIKKVAKSKTGISHCPSSNMRLNYACAPIPALVLAGVKVSIGVDGGASNDTGDYLGELRQVLLVHRIRNIHPEPFNNAMKTIPYEVLKLGTRGGADVLNRTDIGSLEVGKAADIALFNVDRIDFSGSHDPLAALLLCGINHMADTTIVNGKVVVRNSKLVLKDEAEITRGANKAAKALFI
jgi:cytosine/adenosine deaminase-related metal-dependent hydrolase